MEALVLVVGLFLLFWFKEPIKKVARLAETGVNSVVDTAEDSLQVYTNDVRINNGKARGLQREKILKLTEEDKFSTQSEIESLMATLTLDKSADKKD